MTNILTLELDWADGTLQRVVGLIERRGFEIINLEVVDMGLVRRVDATVRSRAEGGKFEVLCRQVDRLFGVSRQERGSISGPNLNHRFPLVG